MEEKGLHDGCMVKGRKQIKFSFSVLDFASVKVLLFVFLSQEQKDVPNTVL